MGSVSQSVFNKKNLFLLGKKIHPYLKRLNEDLGPELHSNIAYRGNVQCLLNVPNVMGLGKPLGSQVWHTFHHITPSFCYSK